MKSNSNNIIIWLGIFFVLQGCMEPQKDKKSQLVSVNMDNTSGIFNVRTLGMEFNSKDTLNSGWNKIVYTNESEEVHFILFDLYPKGKTAKNTKEEILPAFEEGIKLIMAGDMENAVAAFGKLPPWYQEVKYMGGTGLISPKHTTMSTVYLEPGLYIMECYVKMFNGEWHTSHGMYKEIIVTDKKTGLQPPTPTAKIEISSSGGIVLKDRIDKGNQVFEVEFKDQTTYEHFLGHDVNLVKYNATASLDELIHWMNWMNPEGLRTPTPEGFTFLGGVNNLPAKSKGYFEAELTPGNYLLIAEVPKSDEKKLLKKFSVNN